MENNRQNITTVEDLTMLLFQYQASEEVTYLGWSKEKVKTLLLISSLCPGMPIKALLRLHKDEIQEDSFQYTLQHNGSPALKTVITVIITPLLRTLFNALLQDVNNNSPYLFMELEFTKEEQDYLYQLQIRPEHKINRKEVYEKGLNKVLAKKFCTIMEAINYQLKAIVADIEKQANVKINPKITPRSFGAVKLSTLSSLTISRKILGHESLKHSSFKPPFPDESL